MLSSKNYFQND